MLSDISPMDVMTLVSLSQLKAEDFRRKAARKEILGHLQSEDSKAVGRILMKVRAGKKVRPGKYREHVKAIFKMAKAA